MGFFDGGISGLIGGTLGFLGASQQNQANATMASNQMDFQRAMSGTAHQREVADLRAADLNPMLSVNAGASTPGGASGNMVNTADAAQEGLVNATDAAQRGKMNESQIATNASSAALLDKKTETEKSNAQAAKEQAEQSKLTTERIRAGQPAALKWAPYEPMINNGAKILGGVSNAVEAGSALGAAAKFIRQPPDLGKFQTVPKGGQLFNPKTGEVIKP